VAASNYGSPRKPKDTSFPERIIATLGALGESHSWTVVPLDGDNLFVLQSPGYTASALAIHMRPTGVTFEGRQDAIAKLIEHSYKPDYSVRFSLGAKDKGLGKGGITVMAHLHHRPRRPKSRFTLITDDWKDTADYSVGEDLGEVGFLPRELAPHLRPWLYDYPYVIPYYQTSEQVNSHRSLSLVLVLWRMPAALLDRVGPALTADYRLVRDRTNLVRWEMKNMLATNYIKPGYDGLSED
jgi:hypothetical protein